MVLGWELMKIMGHSGLALSLSLSGAVNLMILFWKANTYFSASVRQKMGVSCVKALVFSGIMYGVVGWVATLACPRLDAGKFSLFMGVFISIMSGVLVYVGLFFVGGQREYRRIQRWVKGSKKNGTI